MKRVEKSFTISEHMVGAFATLTGDRNALHMDAEVARRFRYRKPVVHGMLPVSCVMALEEAFPGCALTFLNLTVRFLAPVFADVTISLLAEASSAEEGMATFQAHWTAAADGERLIEASGTCAVGVAPLVMRPLPAIGGCLLLDDVSENALGLRDLQGTSESLAFSVDPGVLAGLQTLVLRPALGRDDYRFCPNLAASLLLSTLVGMRLPGRHATFTAFSATFQRAITPGAPCILSGSVDKVFTASESISVAASFGEAGTEVGAARLKVIVNPTPKKMIDCAAIKERYLQTGVGGRVAVITGASRGIGETAAKLFAMHGAKTIVHYYRGRRDAEAIVDEIRDAGGTALALGCDVRDEQQVTDFFAAVLRTYGRVDILINNAVQEFRPADVRTLRWEDYLEELEVSLKGMHNCCRQAIPIFAHQGGGKIVNVSSVAVDNPVTGQNRYITAKSAIVGYTRSLAKELVKENVQVNLVVPNMTETDLLSSIPSELIARMAADRDYGRHVAPIEVALAMLYLSSGWSDAISGQRIVLNLCEPPFA